MSAPAPRGRWFRRFLLGAVAAVAVVLAATLWLGPSGALSSTGFLVLLVLAWPVVFALASFLLIALVAVFTAGETVGDAGGVGVEAGLESGAWYYRVLLSTRNPVFWGSFAGALLSVAGLYAFVDRYVRPREDAALVQLDRLGAALQTHREEAGSFPEASGETLHEALGLAPSDTWKGEPLVDPWDHPILYRVEDEGEGFRLASPGWNGRPEDGRGDDLVASGEAPSRASRFLKKVRGFFEKDGED